MVLEAPSKKLAALPFGGAIASYRRGHCSRSGSVLGTYPEATLLPLFLLFLELAKAGTRLVDLPLGSVREHETIAATYIGLVKYLKKLGSNATHGWAG